MSLKTIPFQLRPHSPPLRSMYRSTRSSPPHHLLFSPRSPVRCSFSQSSSATTMAGSVPTTTTVEHVVLFKVRDATDQSKIEAMVANLRSLVSLDVVTHLAAASICRHRSAAASAAGFTHLLHSRYRSKPDLATYSAHPSHQAVVKENVLPICEDIMAVDWVFDGLNGPVVPPPGSAVRLTLAKPKEGVTAAELMAVLAEAAESAPAAVRQVSFGENFSPARAKGYSFGFLTVFPGVEELDAMDEGEKGSLDAVKVKVRPLLESAIVLDFVVPPPPATSL